MTTASVEAAALTGTRRADYFQLTRPKLCVMALLTVAAGAVLASGGAPDWRIMAHALAGAALVAAGAVAEPVEQGAAQDAARTGSPQFTTGGS